MAQDDVQERSGLLPPKWKAFLVSTLVDIACLPLVFIMLVFWPIFIMAIAPYLGGYLGGRYTDQRNGFIMGGLAAVLMMTILVAIIFSIISGIPGLGEGFDPFEPIGLSLVAVGVAMAFIFGAMGGRHGARSARERRDED